jgi:hypothetical protein
MIGSKVIVKFCLINAFKSIKSSQGQPPLSDHLPSLRDRHHRGLLFTTGLFPSPTTGRVI